MTFSEIKILLEKFYDGETTLNEENQLRDFFRSGNYPQEMNEDAQYFLAMASMAEESIPDDDFEKEFMERISRGKVVELHPSRSRLYYVLGMAASVLLLAGLFLTFRDELFRKPVRHNADMELAYQQTQDALMLVSSGFNNGLKAVSRLDAYGQGVNDIDRLKIFNKYQSIIINPDESSNASIKNR